MKEAGRKRKTGRGAAGDEEGNPRKSHVLFRRHESMQGSGRRTTAKERQGILFYSGSDPGLDLGCPNSVSPGSTSPRGTGMELDSWTVVFFFSSNPALTKADLFWALCRAVLSTLSKCPGKNAQVATAAGLGDLALGSNCNTFHQGALAQCTTTPYPENSVLGSTKLPPPRLTLTSAHPVVPSHVLAPLSPFLSLPTAPCQPKSPEKGTPA